MNKIKTAIVTGASSGIGYEICHMFLKENIKVYGLGRNFTNEITSDLFRPVKIDLTNITTLCQKINEIKKENKNNINYLVNCAGVGYFGLHEHLNAKKIHEMTVINIEIPMLLTQLLLRCLKNTKGHIINISSVTAKKSNTHGCAYGATKAALTNFSESLFDEVRKYGVKITSIHPDITKTNFYRNADFCQSEEYDTFLTSYEIAKAVKFIISQRQEIDITDITIKPQKHKIQRKI